MRIGIIVNEGKAAGRAVLEELVGLVRASGGEAELLGGAPGDGRGGQGGGPEDGPKGGAGGGGAGFDALISVGGDGTLIRAAKQHARQGTPILGVNLGALGYLNEAEASNLQGIVQRLAAGEYRIEERMMLEARVLRGGGGRPAGESFCALNEVAVLRSDLSRILKLKLYVNDKILDVYPGDGLLVSTPTGSTAYAFSAGGPIVDPELALISVVPLSPHMLFSRPVLLSPDKALRVVPLEARAIPPYNEGVGEQGAATVSLVADGVRQADLAEGDAVLVRRARLATRMIRFESDDFYRMLKNKLYSRGEDLTSEKG